MAKQTNGLQGVIKATTDAFQSGLEAGFALANSGEPWTGQRMQEAGETGSTGGQKAKQPGAVNGDGGRKSAPARAAKPASE